MRVSSHNIDELQDSEIFVFGSNEAGIHGRGAAKLAKRWGAKYGQGNGLHGKTYAIPTKNKRIETLGLGRIKKYVDEFIDFAMDNSHLKFLVTEIGCGLAGYEPQDIAPLFKDCVNLENVYLPRRFWDILTP